MVHSCRFRVPRPHLPGDRTVLLNLADVPVRRPLTSVWVDGSSTAPRPPATEKPLLGYLIQTLRVCTRLVAPVGDSTPPRSSRREEAQAPFPVAFLTAGDQSIRNLPTNGRSSTPPQPFLRISFGFRISGFGFAPRFVPPMPLPLRGSDSHLGCYFSKDALSKPGALSTRSALAAPLTMPPSPPPPLPRTLPVPLCPRLSVRSPQHAGSSLRHGRPPCLER